LTQTGVILGTPAFLSPEQARGEKVDLRSDLFSLGCVLYRMVTGQLPFQGRDVVSSLLSLANDHPKPPRELNPQVPPALNHLIQRLLAKNAADRPSSAESVAKTLRTLDLQEDTAALSPPSPPQPPPLPAPIPPRRRRLVPMALAALALFGMTALLAGIVIRIRSKDGRETTIEVPEGSKVSIEAGGKAVRALPAAAGGDKNDKLSNAAPQGAKVLFDGNGLSGWTKADGTPATWKVANGYMEVGDSNILTKDAFGPDFRLHLEFWLPLKENAKLQDRANSGVYLHARYEIQIIDSYMSDIFGPNSVGSLYGLIAPDKEALQKAVIPPEQWNTYDIIFHAPQVDKSGAVTENGRVTVILNDVTLIDEGKFKEVTEGAIDHKIGEPGPLLLQAYGHKVRYRNIWLLPMADGNRGIPRGEFKKRP
jgi:hypothetical protein